MTGCTELGLVGSAVGLDEAQLITLVKEHNSITNLLSCPICLHLFNLPARTKCGHVFCKDCISDHIQKGGRNVRCPLCNETSLSKRSLVEDEQMSTLVDLFKSLLQAEKDDSHNQLDVTSLRIPRIGSRESNGSPFRVKKSSPLKNKYKAITTYSRTKKVETKNDSTIVFAGERLTDNESDADTDTENIFSRMNSSDPPSLPLGKRRAPDMRRLSSIKARNSYSALSDSYDDMMSQPPPGPAESTPSGTPTGTPSTKTNDTDGTTSWTPGSDVKLDSSGFTGTPGSGVLQRKRKFFKTGLTPGEKTRLSDVEHKKTSRETSPSSFLGDLVTASQAVDVNDTFDKFVMNTKKPTDKPIENKRKLLLYTTSETSVEDSDDGLDGGVGADILRKLKSQTPDIDESTPKQLKGENKGRGGGSTGKLSNRGRRRKSGNLRSGHENIEKFVNKNKKNGKSNKIVVDETDETIVNDASVLSDSDDMGGVGVAGEPGKGLSELLQEAVLKNRTGGEASDKVSSSPQAGTSTGILYGKPPRQTNFYGSQDSSDVMLDEFGLPIKTTKQNEEYEFSATKGKPNKDKEIAAEVLSEDEVETAVTVPEVESFPSVFSATQSQEKEKPRTRRLTKNRKSILPNQDPVADKFVVHAKDTSEMIQDIVDMERKEKSKELTKKLNIFRSKVNTSDILGDWNSTDADSDAPHDPVDNTKVRANTPAKTAVHKSSTKTPTKTDTTEEVRVTRSQTPKVKDKQSRVSTGRPKTPEGSMKRLARSRTPKCNPQEVDELSQNQEYDDQIDGIELRPVTPAQSPPGRITRSRTPGKTVTPGRGITDYQLTTPRRDDDKSSAKDDNKSARSGLRATPKRLKLGSQMDKQQTPKSSPKNKKPKTPLSQKKGGTKKKPKKGRIEFKMLGRLSGDNNVEKYHPIKFVQLGLLADKKYGHKGWPSLQDIIKDKQRQLEEDSQKVYGWLHGDPQVPHQDLPFHPDHHLPDLTDQHLEQFLNNDSGLPQKTKPPSQKVIDDVEKVGVDSLVNEFIDEASGKGDAEFIGGAEIEELPDPNQFSEFMIGVLGEGKSDIYSQNKETVSQEAARLAVQEFIQKEEERNKEVASPFQQISDSPVKKKRVLSTSSTEETAKSRYKRIKSPGTDEEIGIEEKNSEKQKPSLSFQNSFQGNGDSIIVIDDSQENKPRSSARKRQSFKARKPLVEVCNYQDQVLSGSDLGKSSDKTAKVKATKPSRGSTTSEDDQISTQEILLNNHKAAGAVSNMQQSLAKTMEVLSSPNTSCIVTSRLSGKPVTQNISDEREASPIEKMMYQEMIISPEKIELVEDGRDSGNVEYDVDNDISDDEDMFCATPVEISNHRVARDLMSTEQNKSGTLSNAPELAGSTQPEIRSSQQSQIVLESRSLLESGSLEMGLIQNGQEFLEKGNELNKEEGGNNILDAETGDTESISSLTNDDMDDINIDDIPAKAKAAITTNDDTAATTEYKEAVTTDDEAEFKLGSNAKFVMSNLPLQKKEVVTRFLARFRCGELEMGITNETTHIIVKTEQNLYAQRTLKYLQGIGRGLMIVSYLWCEACLEAGRLLDPSTWEAVDTELEGAEGPKLSRLAMQAGNHHLLRGWQLMIVGEITAIPYEEMVDLLTRLGASNVEEYEDFSTTSCKKAVLVDDHETLSDRQARKFLRSHQLAFVDKEWLLETLCSWSVRPLLRYTPQGVTRDNLIELGHYPPAMVGQRECDVLQRFTE